MEINLLFFQTLWAACKESNNLNSIVSDIQSKLIEFQRCNKFVDLFWVSNHINIYVNKQADKLAKAWSYLVSQTSLFTKTITRTSRLSKVNENLRSKWHNISPETNYELSKVLQDPISLLATPNLRKLKWYFVDYTVYTEKNNRVMMTQPCVSNGRSVNVTHVVCRVDWNIVFLPCQ